MLMMATGVGVVFAWGASPWSGSMFKALPGIMVPVLLYGLYWLLARPTAPSPEAASTEA
jgi:hypothetical protein